MQNIYRKAWNYAMTGRPKFSSLYLLKNIWDLAWFVNISGEALLIPLAGNMVIIKFYILCCLLMIVITWMQKEAKYGLTEIYREEIRSARLVANPGCYPTSVLLPLTPLLKVHIHLISIMHYSLLLHSSTGQAWSAISLLILFMMKITCKRTFFWRWRRNFFKM